MQARTVFPCSEKFSTYAFDYLLFYVSEVKGKVYVADIKEKESAKKTYLKAKAAGKTAAHVAAQ